MIKKYHSIFEQSTHNLNTGNFAFLQAQVVKNQTLTRLVKPILPQGEQWQVVHYDNGILSVSGKNHAMINKLRYLQSHYVQQLKQYSELQQLQQLNVVLQPQLATKTRPQPIKKQITTDTRQMLLTTATFVTDSKLSEALVRLASPNNSD